MVYSSNQIKANNILVSSLDMGFLLSSVSLRGKNVQKNNLDNNNVIKAQQTMAIFLLGTNNKNINNNRYNKQ
ncbi:hypothetical protein M8J77_022043 [Diaphorina citri]|nr:hypothetical protein M8J77_022043 [Diaphorina citri]